MRLWGGQLIDDKKPIDAYHGVFATRLRHLLDYHRMTQKNLAQVVGKTPQQISLYANGGSKPDSETLATIAKYFHVTSDYLLGLSDAYSIDGDMQAACKYTGLSEDAVRGIKLCSDIARAVSSINVPKEILENDDPEVYAQWLADTYFPLLQKTGMDFSDLEGSLLSNDLCRIFTGIHWLVELLSKTVIDGRPYRPGFAAMGDTLYNLMEYEADKNTLQWCSQLEDDLELLEYKCQKATMCLFAGITENIARTAGNNAGISLLETEE